MMHVVKGGPVEVGGYAGGGNAMMNAMGWVGPKAGKMAMVYHALDNAEVGEAVPWMAVMAVAAAKGVAAAKMLLKMGAADYAAYTA